MNSAGMECDGVDDTREQYDCNRVALALRYVKKRTDGREKNMKIKKFRHEISPSPIVLTIAKKACYARWEEVFGRDSVGDEKYITHYAVCAGQHTHMLSDCFPSSPLRFKCTTNAAS